MAEKYKLAQGTTVGKWKISDQLGLGGQGEVWSAKPISTPKSPRRAIKFCFANDAQGRARFEREVQLLMQCDSPHILKVLDSDVTWTVEAAGEKCAYYVSEICSPLLKARGADDTRTRLVYFRQACAAVSYLHSMPSLLLHRDIKPDNFLLSRDLNNIVLADFGIAWRNESHPLTKTHEVVGTQLYRAPEVTNGQPATIQSEVYSMGRLLEWLLTDHVSTDMGVRPVPRGTVLDDSACDALDRIIQKATQPKASDRFQSIADLTAALPHLWLTIKVRAIPTVNELIVSNIEAAFEYAATNNQMRWRQIEGSIRQRLNHDLINWQKINQTSDGRVQQTLANELFDISSDRIMFALTGVYSRAPAFKDQRSAVNDFASMPGLEAINQGLHVMLYVFNYLHGALCVHVSDVALALQFATVLVRDNSETERALWRRRDLVAGPQLLGDAHVKRWSYIRQLFEARPIIRKFFPLGKDFEIGMAAYSMLLSMLEFSYDSIAITPTNWSIPTNVKLAVPPLFVFMPEDVIESASKLTFENKAAVASVAAVSGARVEILRKQWPAWKQYIEAYRAKVKDDGSLDDLPLGAMA
jgi:serine/threonine protein kinase